MEGRWSGSLESHNYISDPFCSRLISLHHSTIQRSYTQPRGSVIYRNLLIFFFYPILHSSLDKTLFLSSLLFYLRRARAYCACTPTNHPPTPPLLSSHLLCLSLLLLDTQPSYIHYRSKYRWFSINIWILHILFLLFTLLFIRFRPWFLIFFVPHIPSWLDLRNNHLNSTKSRPRR